MADDEKKRNPPNIVHAFEQLEAVNLDFAGVTAKYFNKLVELKLTREEALQLTVGWQTEMLRRFAYKPRRDDDS